MKKLFLYITILSILFITTFYISRSIFNDIMKNKKLFNTSEISTESTELSILEADSKYAKSIKNNDDYNHNSDDYFSKNKAESDEEKYIVKIKNGYVIVYKNTEDCIFEYTGIDADLLKSINPEGYKKVANHIVFDNKEDLFDFLESLAS